MHTRTCRTIDIHHRRRSIVAVEVTGGVWHLFGWSDAERRHPVGEIRHAPAHRRADGIRWFAWSIWKDREQRPCATFAEAITHAGGWSR